MMMMMQVQVVMLSGTWWHLPASDLPRVLLSG
jgi:hypothetical protein